MTDIADHPYVKEMGRQIDELEAENARLRLFLGEIAAMGPADEEWDANTLEHAVELANRALLSRNRQ